jgi:hypothetical protein
MPETRGWMVAEEPAMPNGADIAPEPLYEQARQHPVEPAPRTR